MSWVCFFKFLYAIYFVSQVIYLLYKFILALLGDPNKCDYLQSRTAMHYAAEQGHVECLQMLVNAGGRYDIKDSSGKNCLDLATPGGRKILEKLGKLCCSCFFLKLARSVLKYTF